MNKPVHPSTVTVTLPSVLVADLERQVAAGEYASLDAAVSGALLDLMHLQAVEFAGGQEAFDAIAAEVAADDDHTGDVDAFVFLEGLRKKYERMAEAAERKA
jgi:Arc/MetJ-type ribon-helix-helix transcriptional regulator